MLSLITGKIKTVIIIVLGLGLPLLYFLGRSSGGSKIKQAILEEEAEKAEKEQIFTKNGRI